jgi:hypothetical protein
MLKSLKRQRDWVHPSFWIYGMKFPTHRQEGTGCGGDKVVGRQGMKSMDDLDKSTSVNRRIRSV